MLLNKKMFYHATDLIAIGARFILLKLPFREKQMNPKHSLPKHSLLVIAVCFAIISCATNVCWGFQAPDFRIVALTGTQAPGTAPGVEFGLGATFNSRVFSAPLINEAGQTAFESGLSNVGNFFVPNGPLDDAIFSEGSGTLDLVVQASDQSPGNVPDGFGILPMDNFLHLRFNAAGQTAFSINTGSNRGVYTRQPGESLEIVALEGGQAPDAEDGVTIGGFGNIGLSDTGQITFDTSISVPSIVPTAPLRILSGIFSYNAGDLTSVVLEDDLAPIPNTLFGGISRIADGTGEQRVDHAVNASGQIAFAGQFMTTFGNEGEGIFGAGPAGINPVVLRGDQVVDAGSVVVAFRSSPIINADGEIAFTGLASGLVLKPPAFGIFSTRSGVLEQIAMTGEQAPGVEQGVTFDFGDDNQFSLDPVLVFNDAGQTAFTTFLAGDNVNSSNDCAIFSQGSGSLQLIAREGDQVPGAEDGLRFGNFQLLNLEFNAAGQIAFRAFVTTDGACFDSAIFATDLDGQLIEIVRGGDVIDVNDDPLVEDLRTVDGLGFASNGGGFTPNGGNNNGVSSRSLNDRGQLAFAASFTDGSEAIIVSNGAVFSEVRLGDVNQDGIVNFFDISAFISVLIAGDFQAEADTNEDGVVDFLDIIQFVAFLSTSS